MEAKERSKRVHPQEKATLLSHWFFLWELPFFYKGYKKQITEKDLYGPLRQHKSQRLGDKLEQAWAQEVKTHSTPSLWRTLARMFGTEFVLYGLVLVPLELVTRLCQPLLIGRLMVYYTSNQTEISRDEAIVYAAVIVLASFFYVVIGHSYNLGLQHLGMKIRISLSSLVYRKCLKLSQRALAENSVGQMVNLLSNDVGRFDFCVPNLHFLWMGPLESLVILGIVYWMLGPTAVVGIVVLLGFIPIQIFLAMKISQFRMKTAVKTDRRVHLMNEIITGVKVIKMYTWEKPFAKLIERARMLEMREIQKRSFLRGVNLACHSFLSRTAIFLCILLFVLTGGQLNPEYVYALSSFYEIIRLGCVIFLPTGMMMVGETMTSVKRIRDFLIQSEVTPTASGGDGINLTKVSAKWYQAPETTLSNISLSIQPKELVTLIGPVGSGKSSFLSVIMQEVPILEGSLQVGGTCSFASQEPWLFSGSIRDNILFGEEYDQAKYKEVVKVCALEHDFSMFSHGDKSLVGERGIMLSGGQKSRINLARAVYKDADFYLLDDPLAAVDAAVGRQIFDRCIKNYLCDKTRVLVTHQLQYLGSVDMIYLVENGTITERGTYQELTEKDNKFLKLLVKEAKHEGEDGTETEPSEEAIEVKEDLESGIVSNHVYRDYFKSGGSLVVGGVVIALLAIAETVAVGGDYFLSFWVNLEQKNSTKDEVLTTDDCFYVYIGLIVALILLALIETIVFFKFCISVSTKLHNRMFRKIVFTTMRFFTTNPSGRILNRFSRDLGLIDENLPPALIDTIRISFNVVAIMVVLSVINPWILIPSVLMFVLFYYYRSVFLASSRNLKRIEGRTRSPIYSHVSSSLEGLSTIRALKAQTKLRTKFDEYQDLHSSSFYMFLACDGAFGFWLDLSCVIYLGVVTFSLLLIGTGNHGANLGLSITQSIMLTGMLQWGMKQSGELENQMTSVERVVEYTNLPPEPHNGTKIPTQWPTEGKIEFKNVSLRYSEDDPWVLKDLNFVLNAKEKIGVVGRTGAGKSSLVSVFFHLAHTQGDVIIDGTNTAEVPLDLLRSQITIIPQEPVLFSGTIRYNLDPFDQYQDSQLWDALQEVEMKTVISELPSGLTSKVSKGGGNFSVGQRQLLCLARAIVKDNKILILDEATANVDGLTDELIQATIRRKFRDCTVITIAHRLHTVMDCDKIMVMDDGRLVEFDRAGKLLEDSNGVFHRLVQQSGKESLLNGKKKN